MDYKIPENLRDIILSCTVTDTAVILPETQLPREVYEQFDKAMTNLGGKWKRGKGHIFPTDPRPKIAALLESGVAVDEQKKFQAFYTPPALAKRLVEEADIQAGHYVLEPSAGHGAIVKAVLETQPDVHLTAVDINPEACRELEKLGIAVYEADFLRLNLKKGDFDRIVMNPPFTKDQDIAHVSRALELLAPGGVLVAIVGPDLRRQGMRRILASGSSEITDIEAGAFKESGTMIATTMIHITKDA